MATDIIKKTRSTCCYCGVGCGVIIESQGDHVIGVSGDPDHPANRGKLCSKGSTLHLSAQSLEGRVLSPSIRYRRDSERLPTDWPTAQDYLAAQFARIIHEHGPDAVAFYVSGQMLTEDYYVFNKLAKGLIGTNNIDTNSRLCMSSAVSGYKRTLGADSVPACYDDIDEADVLLIIGSNMAFAHPVLFRRVEAAKALRPEMMIVVIDPRHTDTAAMADIHLPVMPGSDVALFNAFMHVLIWEDLIDESFIKNHTEHFQELKQLVREYSPENMAAVCGISAADIIRVARLIGASKQSFLSLYCMGLNQSACGSDKNATLINLHLATGKIGKPGCGPFSLTGQPNAMGGREVGGMANLLSAHRDLANPKHRAEVAQVWGVEDVPAIPGKTAVEMFEAIRCGEIKAVWIVCTSPVHSMPNRNAVVEALQKAELVVVQECFTQTDTVPFADVLLPASTWAEKTGTVTNSERCISRVLPAVPAPGEAKHDWQIATEFAQQLALRLGKSAALFDYPQVEAVFEEHKRTTLGRDLDIGGLDYVMLESRGPQQWPLPASATTGKKRLYDDGRFETPTGKAQFVAVRWVPVAEETDARYPFRLLSGRLRDQWHNMSRTGRVSRLYAHSEEAYLDMNRTDMERLQLADGDVAELRSRRGQLLVRVRASDSMRQQQVFLPMHWSTQLMSGAGVNALTVDAIDENSKQPELKHAAVRIEKTILPWRLLLLAEANTAGLPDVLALRAQLQPFLKRFAYASLSQFGRERDCIVLQAWHTEAIDEAWLQELDAIIGLEDPAQVASYSDNKRGIHKIARIENNTLKALRLSGEVAASGWLKELMQENGDITAFRPWLFSPLASPPVNTQARGRIICACMDVSEREIRAAIDRGATLDVLKQNLKCGTGCGSCVPELKQMAGISKPGY